MKVEINAPWYSAWQTFKWAKGVWGVGISSKDIEKAEKSHDIIELSVSHKKYKVDPLRVRRYAEEHGTTFMARKNTLLYVVPETELA